MFRRLFQSLGLVAVAGAALLLTPALGSAQHGGGGHGGGGHGGGGHGGGHSSGGHYEGGHGGYGGYRGYPYGAYGGGYGYYPRYYDRSYYGNYYSSPDYSVTPDYYGDPSADVQASAAVVANFRMPTPDAELWVEGKRMNGQGQTRQFVSPPLDSDGHYTYHFEARWNENGQERKVAKTVDVHAGDRITVDFTRQ